MWAGFGQLHKAAVADGALPAKVKELMALAIAVVKHRDGCIAYHAKAAARRGATPEEVAEALGVALLMDGGSASVYGPRGWDAYREFADPTGEPQARERLSERWPRPAAAAVGSRRQPPRRRELDWVACSPASPPTARSLRCFHPG